MHEMTSDEELLRRMATRSVRSGLAAGADAEGEAAFTALYRRRQGEVYRFALRMSGSAPVAEDTTQEVFLVLIRETARKAREYDPARGPVAAYLIGIARNLVRRSLEKTGAKQCLSEVREPAAAGDPLGDLARSETIESVRQAVLALPVHYREAVVLCDLEEMSYAGAAAALGCAEGTVRSRLHRARALLAERLRGRGVESTRAGRRCFA